MKEDEISKKQEKSKISSEKDRCTKAKRSYVTVLVLGVVSLEGRET